MPPTPDRERDAIPCSLGLACAATGAAGVAAAGDGRLAGGAAHQLRLRPVLQPCSRALLQRPDPGAKKMCQMFSASPGCPMRHAAHAEGSQLARERALQQKPGAVSRQTAATHWDRAAVGALTCQLCRGCSTRCSRGCWRISSPPPWTWAAAPLSGTCPSRWGPSTRSACSTCALGTATWRGTPRCALPTCWVPHGFLGWPCRLHSVAQDLRWLWGAVHAVPSATI